MGVLGATMEASTEGRLVEKLRRKQPSPVLVVNTVAVDVYDVCTL